MSLIVLEGNHWGCPLLDANKHKPDIVDPSECLYLKINIYSIKFVCVAALSKEINVTLL